MAYISSALRNSLINESRGNPVQFAGPVFIATGMQYSRLIAASMTPDELDKAGGIDAIEMNFEDTSHYVCDYSGANGIIGTPFLPGSNPILDRIGGVFISSMKDVTPLPKSIERMTSSDNAGIVKFKVMDQATQRVIPNFSIKFKYALQEDGVMRKKSILDPVVEMDSESPYLMLRRFKTGFSKVTKGELVDFIFEHSKALINQQLGESLPIYVVEDKRTGSVGIMGEPIRTSEGEDINVDLKKTAILDNGKLFSPITVDDLRSYILQSAMRIFPNLDEKAEKLTIYARDDSTIGLLGKACLPPDIKWIEDQTFDFVAGLPWHKFYPLTGGDESFIQPGNAEQLREMSIMDLNQIMNNNPRAEVIDYIVDVAPNLKGLLTDSNSMPDMPEPATGETESPYR